MLQRADRTDYGPKGDGQLPMLHDGVSMTVGEMRTVVSRVTGTPVHFRFLSHGMFSQQILPRPYLRFSIKEKKNKPWYLYKRHTNLKVNGN